MDPPKCAKSTHRPAIDSTGANDSATYRINAMNSAETKKDTEFTTKATLRPNTAVTRPPTDAQIASMADHVALDSALAGNNSSSLVILGIVAVRAGSKNACAATVSA